MSAPTSTVDSDGPDRGTPRLRLPCPRSCQRYARSRRQIVPQLPKRPATAATLPVPPIPQALRDPGVFSTNKATIPARSQRIRRSRTEKTGTLQPIHRLAARVRSSRPRHPEDRPAARAQVPGAPRRFGELQRRIELQQHPSPTRLARSGAGEHRLFDDAIEQLAQFRRTVRRKQNRRKKTISKPISGIRPIAHQGKIHLDEREHRPLILRLQIIAYQHSRTATDFQLRRSRTEDAISGMKEIGKCSCCTGHRCCEARCVHRSDYQVDTRCPVCTASPFPGIARPGIAEGPGKSEQ